MLLSSKEYLDIQTNLEYGFTLKLVRGILRTCSQMHCTDTYWQFNLIIWSFLPNGWVLVYGRSASGLESRCSHLIFSFLACLEQGVPAHSGKYRLLIHSETCTWHDKNIQSDALYRQVLATQLNHLVSLAKLLSVRLSTKWFWAWVLLQWFNIQLSCLFWARSSCTFRQI